jgi:hypothetical protein
MTSDNHQAMAPLIPSYELGLLDQEERNQFEKHVRQCDECFESLYRFTPVSSSLASIRKLEIVKPGVTIQRPRWQWLLAVIMGMILIMAFWLIRQSSKLQDEIMRGAAQIQLLEPKDGSSVQAPVLLRWEEEPEAEFYKVYVFKNETMFVPGERANIPQYEWIPSADRKPGKYQWKVESFFSDGSRIRDSVTFSMKLQK